MDGRKRVTINHWIRVKESGGSVEKSSIPTKIQWMKYSLLPQILRRTQFTMQLKRKKR